MSGMGRRLLAKLTDAVLCGLLTTAAALPFFLLSGPSFHEMGMMFLHTSWLIIMVWVIVLLPIVYRDPRHMARGDLGETLAGITGNPAWEQ